MENKQRLLWQVPLVGRCQVLVLPTEYPGRFLGISPTCTTLLAQLLAELCAPASHETVPLPVGKVMESWLPVAWPWELLLPGFTAQKYTQVSSF